MNKSKLIATSAIATVMTATAAHAELSISGGMAGWWITGDSNTSVDRRWNTESVNVTYSDTLDNGMGISVTANVGETGNSHQSWGHNNTTTTGGDVNYTMSISSDMGSISFGDQMASATDRADNIVSMSLMECCTMTSTLPDGMTTTAYNDGDNMNGNANEGVEYTSPSINGWTLRLSHMPTSGNASETAEDSNQGAISGAIGPFSVAAGINSVGHDGTDDGYDSSFGAASMSLGSMTVTAGMFNGGASRADTNVLVLDVPIMGMSGKVTYADHDESGAGAYDDSGYRVGLSKSLGAASFAIEYDNADIASGNDGEVETWRMGYAIYF